MFRKQTAFALTLMQKAISERHSFDAKKEEGIQGETADPFCYQVLLIGAVFLRSALAINLCNYA